MATTGNNSIEINRNTGCEGLSSLPPPTEEDLGEVRLSIGAAILAGLLHIGEAPNECKIGERLRSEDAAEAIEELMELRRSIL